MLFACFAYTQSADDLSYLKQADEENYFLHDHHQRVEKAENNSNLNPGVWFLNIYKTLIADQLSTGCVYQITCSDFMRLAIAEYNLIKGFFLGLDRLSRCNNLSMKDIPENKFDKKTQLIHDHPKDYEF